MCRRRDGAIEPFPCAFRLEVAEMICERLARGECSVRSLVDAGLAVGVECPGDWPVDVWTNLNRPEDLQAWVLEPR
jgi:molybdopterin-guanine dinucleotide biosynthesis protein A